MSADSNFEHFDYLFVGSGTSAALLLMSMERKGLLNDKKIVIIDPDEKAINDKTFCFWTNYDEQSNLLCSHLISKEWNSFRKQDGTIESEPSLRYNMVKSIDLYNEMKRIAFNYSITIVQETVTHLSTQSEGVLVNTSHQKRHAQIVFDSRPPQFLPPLPNESHLLQSFYGYFITCDKKNEEHEAIDIMDFDVAQAYETQFLYVLPFDENNLLVELTRFGKLQINEESAAILLNEYILKRFGSYTITAIERGVIPMSTAAIHSESHPSIVKIGARSGAIKPSTGYAFKNMMHHAEKITDDLFTETNLIFSNSTNRFKQYDRLLLKILSDKPHLGKTIFQQLFSKNPTATIFSFLDEKTTLKEELKLFSTLPISTFLKAFILDLFSSKRREMIAIALILIAFSLILLQQISSTLFTWTNNSLLISGLLTIGIPHGAVDHLLTSDKTIKRPTVGFILRYLTCVIALFVVWMITPQLTLLFFIVYSSWHFGESDLFHWGIFKNKVTTSWIWGSALLLLILSSHFSESRKIISHLGIDLPAVLIDYAPFFSAVLIFGLLILVKVTRNFRMFLSLILLICAIQLPLLTAFGLYFIGQHSLNSWGHIKKGLAITNKQFVLKALPFTLGSFFLFGILFYLIKNEIIMVQNYNWTAIIFIFISCISLPHILVIHSFYINKK